MDFEDEKAIAKEAGSKPHAAQRSGVIIRGMDVFQLSSFPHVGGVLG